MRKKLISLGANLQKFVCFCKNNPKLFEILKEENPKLIEKLKEILNKEREDYMLTKDVEVKIEHSIIFKNNEEFYSSDKSKTDEIFEDEKENIEQYYAKKYVKVAGEWLEDEVIVYY